MTNDNQAPLATPPLLADPQLVERTGSGLAARLREVAPTAVACWDSSEDAVLAHVVARELGTGVWRATEIEGIVALERELPAGARVALVGERFRTGPAVAGLSGVVVHGGGSVVAVASVHPGAPVAGTDAERARVVTAEAT